MWLETWEQQTVVFLYFTILMMTPFLILFMVNIFPEIAIQCILAGLKLHACNQALLLLYQPHCLLLALLMPYSVSVELLLLQTKHFLLLLLQSNIIQLGKYSVALVVKQSQEKQCICLAPTTFLFMSFSGFFHQWIILDGTGGNRHSERQGIVTDDWLSRVCSHSVIRSCQNPTKKQQKRNESPGFLCQYWTRCLFMGYVDKPT